MLFPLPEGPTRATFCPGLIDKETFFKITFSALVGEEKLTFLNSIFPSILIAECFPKLSLYKGGIKLFVLKVL